MPGQCNCPVIKPVLLGYVHCVQDWYAEEQLTYLHQAAGVPQGVVHVYMKEGRHHEPAKQQGSATKSGASFCHIPLYSFGSHVNVAAYKEAGKHLGESLQPDKEAKQGCNPLTQVSAAGGSSATRPHLTSEGPCPL